MSFMKKIDSETQVDFGSISGNEPDVIDHAESARENLRAIGDDLKAILPDKTAMAIAGMTEKDGGGMFDGLGRVISFLALPWAIALDAIEVPLMPLVAVKDGLDAAAHGILAGLRGTTPIS
jgi:hypothetical protein